LHYAAIENGNTTVSNRDSAGELDNYEFSSATAYLVSGDQLNVTKFFPDTFAADGNGNRPFCQGCDFLKWGAWGARVNFGNSSASQYTDNIHLGWWVAGDITSVTDLNQLGNQYAIATYNGHVLADVATNLYAGGWKTYVAAGDLSMSWSFAPRSGNLQISRFDTANFNGGLTFGGTMSAPGQLADNGNHFSSSLNGQLPGDLGSLNGSAAGSFVNNGAIKAGGVIGNWNNSNSAYRAGGIFAGVGTPQPGPH
jgi:hypothetical protein